MEFGTSLNPGKPLRENPAIEFYKGIFFSRWGWTSSFRRCPKIFIRIPTLISTCWMRSCHFKGIFGPF
jgi:hypothetical protein